jgi:hypothetical protein
MGGTSSDATTQARPRLGLFVVAMGLTATVVLTLVAERWRIHAADVGTIVSSGGLVGTVGRAFLRASVGSAGYE